MLVGMSGSGSALGLGLVAYGCFLLIGGGISSPTWKEFKHEQSVRTTKFAADAAAHVINKKRSGDFVCGCIDHACGDVFNLPDSTCVNTAAPLEDHFCRSRNGCTPTKLHFNKSFLRSPPEQNLDFSSPKDDETQELINQICLFKSLDDTRIFLDASEFETKGFNGWTYTGLHTGMMITFPGRARDRFGSDHHGASCEPYDPTLRPWYGPAMSARKSIVILVHTSATQQARRIVAKVLTTLTYSDNVSLLVVNSDPQEMSIVYCAEGRDESDTHKNIKKMCIDPATEENVKKVKAVLDEPSVASLVPAFEHAFDLLDSVSGDKMILFMASETFSPKTTEKVLQAVEDRQKGHSDKVSVLGYSFDTQSSDDGLARQLACENEGVFTSVDASANMKPYFSFISMPAEHAKMNPSFVHFTPPYQDAGHLGLVITSSMAMFEEFENCDPSSMGQKRRLLGVAGSDKKVSVLKKQGLMDDNKEQQDNLERPLSKRHVKGLNCQLQILREVLGYECPPKRAHSEKCFRAGDTQHYFIPPERTATADDARASCAEIGGRLANPGSAQKRALFASVVPRSGVWIDVRGNGSRGSWGEDCDQRNSFGRTCISEGRCGAIDPRGTRKNIVSRDCNVALPYMCEFDAEPAVCQGSVFDVAEEDDKQEYAKVCQKANKCEPPPMARVKAPQGGPLCHWPPFSNYTDDEDEKNRVCCSDSAFEKACPREEADPIFFQPPFIAVFVVAAVLLLLLAIPCFLLIHQRLSRPPQPIAIATSVLKMEKRLGEGFSGEVHVATWNGAKVAVKIFHYPERKDAKSELTIFRVLPHHPNIIRCIGVRDGNEEGTVALILELMEMNLEQFLANCPQHQRITYRTLFQLFFDVASGLDHLHHHNFLHLDLNPRNILINLNANGGSPIVKLCDFGLSIECVTNSINLAHSRGTPGYIARELQRHSMHSVVKATRKADIWSLGMIMHNCLVPSSDSTLEASVSSEILDGVMPLIESCKAWGPADRPSAREVCNSLKNLMRQDWADRCVYGEPSTMDSSSTMSSQSGRIRTVFTNPPPRAWLSSSGASTSDQDIETVYVDANSRF